MIRFTVALALAALMYVAAPYAQVAAPASADASTFAKATADRTAGKLQATGQAIPPDLALDRTLPIDPAVRSGRLPNGLRYFVRYNARPEKRVSMRLAVNAGAIQEDADQRGLAHFLEHMAFNGTKN